MSLYVVATTYLDELQEDKLRRWQDQIKLVESDGTPAEVAADIGYDERVREIRVYLLSPGAIVFNQTVGVEELVMN